MTDDRGDERWRRLEELYHAAAALPATECAAFLDDGCGSDLELRRELDVLLSAACDAERFLEARGAVIGNDHICSQSGSLVGRQVGPYQVGTLLGVGGMGEVYRARDTQLGRDVAIKVLPAIFTTDPERLARFEREARLLAAVNHPNIGAIYGLENVGGARGLVLELVEGPTLAERLASGALSVEETLAIARQIADALEAAHEKGIVHRDLKPANIKITAARTVKVLDFSVAKVSAGEGAGSALSQSPTVSAGGTAKGLLLGTVAYMSPEQARGHAVDKRVDIWAFGCVLFEMLTGKQAFGAETISDTIAAILNREPEWSSFPRDIPAGVLRLLRRCLEKDPKRRLRDIGDAGFELNDPLTRPSTTAAIRDDVSARTSERQLSNQRPQLHLVRQWSPWVVVLLVIGSAAWFARGTTRVSGSHAIRVDLAPPQDATFITGMSAIAPDARHVAFVAQSAAGTSLWIYSFETGANRKVPGTVGATFPFWSADGRSVAFFASGALRRVDISASGGPVVVCEAPVGRGGAWNANGVIIFNAVNDGPLLRVAASGGTPVALTAIDASNRENSHRFPAFFADGDHFVFFVRGRDRNTQGIYLSSLSNPHGKSLLVRSATSGIVATSPADRHEYLLWIDNAVLRTQRIDPAAGVIGEPTTVIEPVGLAGAVGQSPISASHDGSLVIESAPEVKAQLSWYERDGKVSGRVGDPDAYRDARISPDGRTIAVLKYDRQLDVWLIDVERGVSSRFTFEGAGAGASTNDFAWSPDGKRLAYANGAAPPNIVARVIGEPVVEERLAESHGSQTCPDWSTDGAWLLYTEIPNDPTSKTRSDLYARRLNAASAGPILYLASAFGEKNGRFSPDGKWVAYTSDESGRDEVYVASFPAGRGKWRISTAGGDFSRWRNDGRELFYAAPDTTLMAVTVRAEASSLQFGAPISLFRLQGPPGSFDIAADGQRVLALTPTGSERSNTTLLVNWPAVVQTNGNVR